MSRLIILDLTDAERAALEKGHRHGESHSFRTRCHMILLKAERLTSAQVAERVGSCMMSADGWIKRHRAEGIDGLTTRAGRGRPILDDGTDLERVRAAVQSHRQKIGLARAELEAGLGKEFSAVTLKRFLKKHRCRYKRLRKRTKGQPDPDVYALRAECLAELEGLSERGRIDLFYGDESGVSLEPCVPYAWQFADEEASVPAAKGGGVNCSALLSRDCRCVAKTTPGPITGGFVAEQLDRLSLRLPRPTVVVLDNAPIHHGKAVRRRLDAWQERGLFVFYLPAYSPHLNIAEVLWRKLKYEWLVPEDYADEQTLHHQVWSALKAVGQSLTISFSPFRQSGGLSPT